MKTLLEFLTKLKISHTDGIMVLTFTDAIKSNVFEFDQTQQKDIIELMEWLSEGHYYNQIKNVNEYINSNDIHVIKNTPDSYETAKSLAESLEHTILYFGDEYMKCIWDSIRGYLYKILSDDTLEISGVTKDIYFHFAKIIIFQLFCLYIEENNIK